MIRHAVALVALLILQWQTGERPVFPAPPWAQSGSPGKFRPDDPILIEPQPFAVTSATLRKISDVYDVFLNTFSSPAERHPKKGAPIPAQGVNTLGEVTDTAWYVGRHYFQPMSLEELVRGPGDTTPPAEGQWTVVSAKNEGVTPGFVIKDAKGELYVMKFDPKSNPEIASAADVISSKIFYALGYHVPENYIVRFDHSRLVLGAETQFVDQTGYRRKMREQDLADILVKVPRDEAKTYRAVASRYLVGKPVGPRRFHGTRKDDPNDGILHEHRRDLRGLRVFCAWLDHDDSRSLNSLDAIVNESGIPFIKHYLVDFGSTLGSASNGPNSPRSGFEELFSWKASAREFFTLGLYVPHWARVHYPDLPSVGRFEYKAFDPVSWTPEYHNPAFSNTLPDDAFWAARQVMAFTDEQIGAIVKAGEFRDPRATEWVTKCLIERRNKIGTAFLSKVLPLDRFMVQDGALRFVDLSVSRELPRASPTAEPGIETNGISPRYQIQWAEFDNSTGLDTPIPGEGLTIPMTSASYVRATITAGDPKKSVHVYLRRQAESWTVVGIDRTW
jgi:hypothetical protein